MTAAQLPGASPWKELAIAAIESSNGCQRDVSMKASPFRTALANLNTEEKAKVSQFSRDVSMQAKKKVAAMNDVEDLPGIVSPWGFWDPLALSADITEGRLLYFREAELKHGRVCMLATLGFLVGENFHPLFGGDIDAPAYLAFQQTPLQTFWPFVVTAIAILEVFSVFSFNSPAGGEPWSIRSDHVPGDLGFDPFNLKPTDPEELKTMQTKELNNGRMAMGSFLLVALTSLTTGKSAIQQFGL